LEEYPSEGWPRTSLDQLIAKIDNGLSTDRIIVRGFQRSVRTRAAVGIEF